MAILAVALGLRVGYVLATPGYVPRHDDQKYDRLAVGVARTGAYPDIAGRPTAYRPPGYTYFLAGVYTLSGTGPGRIEAGRLAQAAVGTLLVGLIGLLARRLFGPGTALLSMALAALYVPLITAGTSLLAEPLTAAFTVGVVLAVLAWRDRPRWRWVVLAGVLAGLASLTRTNACVIIPALALGLFRRRPARRSVWPAAAAVAVAVAVVAPWTARNAVVMHSFIPISDEAGGTLAGTYNPVSAHDPSSPGSWVLLAQIPTYEAQVRPLAAGPENVYQSKLLSLALGYMGRHPLYVAKVAWYNTLRFFDLTGMARVRFTSTLAGVNSPAAAEAGAVCSWIVAALAAVGVARRRVRQAVPLSVSLVPLLTFASIVAVNMETPRFRLPLDPFLLVLAAAAVTHSRKRMKAASGRRWQPVPPSLSCRTRSSIWPGPRPAETQGSS